MDNTKIENTIQELANIQSQCQELIDRIREIEKEIEQINEPEFERVPKGENYFIAIVNYANGKAIAENICEDYVYVDDERFDNNNYFKTAERAKEVVDKINFLLKLERLHDTFCPDFNLGLRDGLDVEKYYVYYNFVHEQWMSSCMIHASSAVQVYFSTKEIAQKVCDILNAESE